MSIFTEAELTYLQSERRLARIATVGPDGAPHVTPVGWTLNTAEQVIEITGINLARTNLARTKKFRDIARTHRAALVIDDVLPPWQPRGIEIRGRADAITEPEPCIRIHLDRIIGWGLDGRHNARDIR